MVMGDSPLGTSTNGGDAKAKRGTGHGHLKTHGGKETHSGCTGKGVRGA